MKKAYLGIDIGTTTTKGVIIDENNNILTSSYIYNDSSPIKQTQILLKELNQNTKDYKIVSVGVTGYYRKLLAPLLGATTIKNEITSLATATSETHKNTQTIIDIGGKDTKIIKLKKGIIIDYENNNLNTSNLGIYLSTNPITKDIITNISKNITPPIVLTGGVSQNNKVVKSLEEVLGYKIKVDKSSHLMTAIGVAILSKKTKEINFTFDILDKQSKYLQEELIKK